jgi:glycosyltransferase involved in cell wall biosynthesis
MVAVGFLTEVLQGSGGMELAEFEIAAGLARRGWDVRASFHTGGDLTASWESVAMLRGPGTDPTELFAPVDVLYCHAPARFAEALQLGRTLDRPVVLHLHLPPFHVRTGWRALRGRTRAPFEPEVYGPSSSAARVLVVSAHMRKRWRQAGVPDHKLHVVRNGVDTERFRPARPGEREATRAALGLRDDAVVFGYVGRLQATKGIEQLLDAFGAVRTAHLGAVELVVAGEPSRFMGADGAAYERALRASAPAGVHWLGRRRDVPELVRAVDVLVVPSQWEEPFGLVVAEAMASGVPVVATRRGGLPEQFPEALAELVVGTRPEALARAMRALADDGARRRELGALGRRHAVAHLSLDATLDAVEANLSAVLLPRRGVAGPSIGAA